MIGTGGGSAWSDVMQRMHEAGLSMAQTVGAATQTVVKQAYIMAALDFFWASAWISLLLIPLVWLTRRSISSGAAVAAD